MPISDLLDYYFQDLAQTERPDFCKAVLVEARVFKGSDLLTQEAESTFDKACMDQFKTEARNNWVIAAAAFYVFRKFKAYSLEFYAASVLFETYVRKRPFRAGYPAAEMIWKFKHETSAILGQKNKKALEAAEDAKPVRAPIKREKRLKLVSELRHQLKRERGADAMRKDLNAALSIHLIVKKDRYAEF